MFKKHFGMMFSVMAFAVWTQVALSANRVIELSDSEHVAIFDEAGTHKFNVPATLSGTIRLLIVGGGGSGGGTSGGGGGGGQVLQISEVTLPPEASLTVVVGAGGQGGTGMGNNGGTSTFLTYSAVGGGGGGGGWSAVNGNDGANGGGAGGNGNVVKTGGAATVEGGFPGADSIASFYGQGGGGGAAEAGHSRASGVENPGCGGAGIISDITGEEIMYGYGGGSTQGKKSGAQNEWGMGDNGATSPATQGQDGTGGGGGGGSWNSNSRPSGAGGTGTVIIRYAIDTAKDDFSANIVRSIKVPTTVTFTAKLATPLSEMTWNFGDGSAEQATSELSISHTYTTAGVYKVTMVHGSQTITKADYIEIVSGTLFVDAASTSPQPPYNTRATAAVKVTDALKYAENGFEVRIAPGEYPLDDYFKSDFNYVGYNWNTYTLPLFVSNAVHIVGEGSSPTSVVIRSVRRRGYFIDMIAVLDNAGAVIENLTMADGSASNRGWGGALWITGNGGVVSNCVIRNGFASIPVQAKTGGAYLNAGLVTHTVFEDCVFNGTIYKDAIGQYDLGSSRVASGAYVCGSGRIENCLFRNCTSDFGDVVAVADSRAAVVNCTIVDGQIGYWTSKNNRNTSPIIIGGVEYKAYTVIVEAVTNDGYAVGCSAGEVKNCAAYNVKRVAYLDRPETYAANFGPDAAKFTTCVAAAKSDFENYDAGKLKPAVSGALYDKGTEVAGYSSMLDLVGNPRVQGKAIDIGCYEAQIRGLVILIR